MFLKSFSREMREEYQNDQQKKPTKMYKLYKSNMYRYVTDMYTYIQYTYIHGYLCTVHGIYRLLAEILEPARESYYQHTILYMCDNVLSPVSGYIHTQAYIDADTHGLL